MHVCVHTQNHIYQGNVTEENVCEKRNGCINKRKLDEQRKTRQTDTVSPLRTQEETDHARIVPTEDEVSVAIGDGGGGVLVLALLPFPPSLFLLPLLLLFLLLFLVLVFFLLLFLVIVRLRPVDSPQVVATFQLKCRHHLRTYAALWMETNKWSQQLGGLFFYAGCHFRDAVKFRPQGEHFCISQHSEMYHRT